MRDKSILIVDDVEINRELLSDIFSDNYKIIEAADGTEAIEVINSGHSIAAVLLDLVMPKADGLCVLREMNRTGLIRQIPVFLITSADNRSQLMQGYDLGAVDVIKKPFISAFLKCRINNVIELYEHRHNLECIVADQIKKLNAFNQSLVETLATVIEFRDYESGEHVKHICILTRILMERLSDMYPEYHMPQSEIDKIATSSILHDVGKISIPDRILSKPGRLTEEEFEIMKEHSAKGCEILRNIPEIMDKEIYGYSYDICRHHHERWDGKGYPDGLKGDEISIWVQAVSVADVYDALTSDRVYKKAFDHETAVKMINDGNCGAFNPKVLKAFNSVLDVIKCKKQEMQMESLKRKAEIKQSASGG